MRAVIQRVNSASVNVDGEIVGQTSQGLLILVGFGMGDAENPPLKKFLDKCLNMRIFPDEKGRFDQSLIDISGGLLLVPQFTLFADCTKGRRPEFFGALEPNLAEQHFLELVRIAKTSFGQVEAGVFGADMKVSLENDGPVTIILDF